MTKPDLLMENQDKFATSKELLAFLAETFPACFSLTGEPKPLKIGIFQELAGRLAEDARVSKTLLRSTLRHYTNSWRYLQSIKEGVHRVDLDGKDDAIIEKEHADHALKQFEESRAKAAEKRKEQAAKAPTDKKSYKNKGGPKFKSNTSSIKTTNSGKTEKSRVKMPPPEKLSAEHLVSGTSVTVKVGTSPMPATITEVAKDGIHVQLDSGMVVKVQESNLRLARPKR